MKVLRSYKGHMSCCEYFPCLLYFCLNLGSWMFFFSLGSGGLEFLEMGFGELFQIEVIWKEERDWINVG